MSSVLRVPLLIVFYSGQHHIFDRLLGVARLVSLPHAHLHVVVKPQAHDLSWTRMTNVLNASSRSCNMPINSALLTQMEILITVIEFISVAISSAVLKMNFKLNFSMRSSSFSLAHWKNWIAAPSPMLARTLQISRRLKKLTKPLGRCPRPKGSV